MTVAALDGCVPLMLPHGETKGKEASPVSPSFGIGSALLGVTEVNIHAASRVRPPFAFAHGIQPDLAAGKAAVQLAAMVTRLEQAYRAADYADRGTLTLTGFERLWQGLGLPKLEGDHRRGLSQVFILLDGGKTGRVTRNDIETNIGAIAEACAMPAAELQRQLGRPAGTTPGTSPKQAAPALQPLLIVPTTKSGRATPSSPLSPLSPIFSPPEAGSVEPDVAVVQRRLRSIFDKCGPQNGRIAVGPLTDVLARMGLTAPEEQQQLRDAIERLDADGDGLISFGEFQDSILAMLGAQSGHAPAQAQPAEASQEPAARDRDASLLNTSALSGVSSASAGHQSIHGEAAHVSAQSQEKQPPSAYAPTSWPWLLRCAMLNTPVRPGCCRRSHRRHGAVRRSRPRPSRCAHVWRSPRELGLRLPWPAFPAWPRRYAGSA